MTAEGLTDNRLSILRSWRFIDELKNVRVVQARCHEGYARINEQRQFRWLVANGWLEESPHDDWYLTNQSIDHLTALGDDMERE